jgi:hypothetical protein
MARTATPPAKPVNAPMNEAALAEDTAAMNQLAVIQHEADERVHALAIQLNYQGSTDPAVLENSARDAIQRIGMGIFELGGYLLLMKEACGHGKFLPALERLGLEPRVAQQYMTVTRRFANTKSTSHLGALGVTKLVELLPLDDEQLVDLTGLGETGELALDKAATMSVRELRAAVRELTAEKEAEEAVRAGLHKRVDKLEREVARFERLAPDEKLQALQKDVTDAMNDASGAILGRMRQAVIALVNSGDDRHAHDVLLAGLVGQVQARLSELRQEFNLPDVSEAGIGFEPDAAAAIREGLAQMRAAKVGATQ